MKIAIASSDGKNVDLHFGKANSIYVYYFDGENSKFIEHRTVEIDLNERHQWTKVLDVISDCDIIMSAQTGFKSKYGIEKAGLKSFEVKGPIETVLKKYIDHYKFMNDIII
ncbi:MAG: FeMo cofactor biosynthesis protein [Methanobrevibacter sp.]|jgi:predicted Fe-Mo cluster-binding NifX family protein|nr:FeMo cofactor biosynthesis protein [Methanobrevibacter sp.]